MPIYIDSVAVSGESDFYTVSRTLHAYIYIYIYIYMSGYSGLQIFHEDAPKGIFRWVG